MPIESAIAGYRIPFRARIERGRLVITQSQEKQITSTFAKEITISEPANAPENDFMLLNNTNSPKFPKGVSLWITGNR